MGARTRHIYFAATFSRKLEQFYILGQEASYLQYKAISVAIKAWGEKLMACFTFLPIQEKKYM